MGIKNLVCPEIVNKNLRVTKEIWFENSGPFRFCKFSNWQTQCKIWVVDVPIMWRMNVKFEKTSKLKSLYHLKNSNKISYEPWLKPQYYWPLSHGSNPHIIWLWAMAQTHIWHADFHMDYLPLFLVVCNRNLARNKMAQHNIIYTFFLKTYCLAMRVQRRKEKWEDNVKNKD